MVFNAAAFLSVACNLNGVLLNGFCECDVAWTGANCTELSVLPTNATSGLVDADARGVHLSTWGGSVLVDDYGTWHMWAARMVGNCGIGSWLSNSEIVHATANSPTGKFAVDSVVWPIWAHEPTVARAPSGEFVMWWTGNNGSGVLANPGGQVCTTCVDGSTPPSCRTGRNWSVPLPTYMSWAASPRGPWAPPVLIPSVQPLIDTNLAGVILANGSFVGLWRDNSGKDPGPSALHRCTAANWRDPSTYFMDGTFQLNEEDPTVWVDKRGGFHVLTHSGCQGRHGFSADGGVSWQYTQEGNGVAFGCGVRLGNGTLVKTRRRERPHAVLDAEGRLAAVTSAVQPVEGGGANGDLTFTLAVPVRTAAARNAALPAMGPLLPHTQALQQPGGVCLNGRCVDAGKTPTADACAALCSATPWCSSMTWAGPGNNCCQLDCYLRYDGVFQPATCGSCDQASANKTSGWVPGGPPLAPSCATNGRPCPPPNWAPEWNLTRSTAVQPWCRDAFTPAHPWGLVSLAWDCSEDGAEEAATVAVCADLKARGVATRCFMYHNQELALRWLESQRAALDDGGNAGWFLRWPNGTVYTEPETSRAHGGYEAQAFWDFRNTSASDYFVTSVLAALSSPYVDGTFADDVDGVPDEHPWVVNRTNLTAADVQALRRATQATNMALINATVAAGKYVWQAFGAGDGATRGPAPATCAAWMRERCAPERQGEPLLQQHDAAAANQSVAAFLVVRPPIGLLGWGWYSNDKNWDRAFLLQPGTPEGLCKEGPTGVFSRRWSAGVAALDCNAWVADLPFPSLPEWGA